MTFEEAGQQYAALRQQRDAGMLADAVFRQMVAQLLVVDPEGSYWQLDADSGQWLTYRNNAWVAAGAAQPGATGRAPAAKTQPAAPATGWGQRAWDIISVGGSAVMSAFWYWYSGMAETKPDYKTCIAMVVLPLALVIFRKRLDRLLLPLEPIRSKIPRPVLAGCGVAIPFLVANSLYSSGVTQFPFMFRTYVYSTLLSFIVLRTPTGGRVIKPPISMPAGS